MRLLAVGRRILEALEIMDLFLVNSVLDVRCFVLCQLLYRPLADPTLVALDISKQ